MQSAETDNSTKQAQKHRFRTVVAAPALAGAVLLGLTFSYFVARDVAAAEPWMMEVFRAHTAAVLGLPSAALAAFCVVLLLEAKSGDIEFEGLGFKFKGASGEVVLWVLCFSVMVASIKLLW